MNIQPYTTPPCSWPPKLTPWVFRMLRGMRIRDLRRNGIVHVEISGLHHLARAVDSGAGVLLTPNHSFHYDSYCLLQAADDLGKPFYFLTAWQVFGVSTPLQRWMMQRGGCFSINREGTDMEAFKTSVDILQNRANPLVIFPEGDIYHTNDRVTPFREGAAAIALSAAKKTERPIVAIPVAIKSWYLDDPTDSMEQTVAKLEQRLWWNRPAAGTLVERVYRIAEALLALKEYEHLGRAYDGSISERIGRLASAVLSKYEQEFGLTQIPKLIPERIKEIRRRVITAQTAGVLSLERERYYDAIMNDMFFVTQLYSYPGDYVANHPSWERLAETIDKLEEDVLQAVYPSVRGTRKVAVRFGDPITIERDRGKKDAIAQLTNSLEQKVQELIDQLNREHSAATETTEEGAEEHV